MIPDEIIKYLTENLSIKVETECPIYSEPGKIKVKLMIDDIVISESNDLIYTD